MNDNKTNRATMTKVKLFYARHNEEGNLYTAGLSAELTENELQELKRARHLDKIDDIILNDLAKWEEEESFAGFERWEYANGLSRYARAIRDEVILL